MRIHTFGRRRHDRLQATGIDREVVVRLVALNWGRTVAWTLASLSLLFA